MTGLRIAAAALMAEHPMGEAHALHEDVDVTLCGLTVPPLHIAWRAGAWPPPARVRRCIECDLRADEL